MPGRAATAATVYIRRRLPRVPGNGDKPGKERKILPSCMATIIFPVWRQLEFPVQGG